MGLPKIIKDCVDLEINPQLCISLFPEDVGQPKIDIVRINFTQLEGKKTSIYLTPDEALELSSALSQISQFYLYNQAQYRKDILRPKEKMIVKRIKKSKIKK